ncbi:MAG: competence protein ComEC, partial [Rhodoblastus sp.]
TIWRTWTFRASAIPFALVGLIGAANGPRYDVIVAPSGDEAAVRDADGKLMIVGKRFNAFAAEQWLTADGDGRDPAQARDPDAPCDRLGCVAALPEGESLSLVLDRLAFEEDCGRAEIVVSALTAPGDFGAKFVLDEKALAKLGAVGLTWSDDKGFTLAADRTTLQNRPWSPLPPPAPGDRIVRPGHATHGAEPADPDEEAPRQP